VVDEREGSYCGYLGWRILTFPPKLFQAHNRMFAGMPYADREAAL
jgi:hypothetical protein